MEMSCTIGYSAVIGRVLVGLFFVWVGVCHARNWQQNVDKMRSQNIFLPTIALWLGVLISVLGGLVVVLGWKMRIAIALLIIMLALIALVGHRFWTMQGEERCLHSRCFMTKIALIGALLMAGHIHGW